MTTVFINNPFFVRLCFELQIIRISDGYTMTAFSDLLNIVSNNEDHNNQYQIPIPNNCYVVHDDGYRFDFNMTHIRLSDYPKIQL